MKSIKEALEDEKQQKEKLEKVRLFCCCLQVLLWQKEVPGGTPEKLGRGVWPASQNPYPIYDQNQRFSLPY